MLTVNVTCTWYVWCAGVNVYEGALDDIVPMQRGDQLFFRKRTCTLRRLYKLVHVEVPLVRCRVVFPVPSDRNHGICKTKMYSNS